MNLDQYKYYSCNEFTLFNGDSRNVIAEMPENSIDSIVCDPPYELGFMGKSWDSTGIANDVQLWKEVLRVLKPGGHILAFSGSRTYHRMAVAIEDAGFEIRDQIMWVYGSGFPKSLNIAKSIKNKITTGSAAKNGFHKLEGERTGEGRIGMYDTVKEQGFRKVNPDQLGAFNLEPTTDEARQWQGWGTALKPAHEPIVLARKPFNSTVANNVLTYGVGGLNIDGSRVGTTVETWPASRSYAPGQLQPGGKGETQATGDAPAGRFPANFIHDGSDEVVGLFPHLKGKIGMVGNTGGNNKIYGKFNRQEDQTPGTTDSGSAARFFYCAKASKRDRNEGLDGFETKEIHGYGAGIGEDLTPNAPALDKNYHPTVKPINLMQYLCRLITPPNGTILDPFLGSGSTGKAAMYEGFNFVGIELTQEYLPIAKARIEFALNNKNK
jgi:DNA modification methylase